VPDVVTESVDNLKALIATVEAITQKLVYLYDQDELLDERKKIGYPAVGVVYSGMRAKSDSTLTGLAVDITLDVYLIGGELCGSKIGATDEKISTTSLLADIRDAIRCNIAPGQRKWKFVFELPSAFDQEVLGYVQRWSTTLILTSD